MSVGILRDRVMERRRRSAEIRSDAQLVDTGLGPASRDRQDRRGLPDSGAASVNTCDERGAAPVTDRAVLVFEGLCRDEMRNERLYGLSMIIGVVKETYGLRTSKSLSRAVVTARSPPPKYVWSTVVPTRTVNDLLIDKVPQVLVPRLGVSACLCLLYWSLTPRAGIVVSSCWWPNQRTMDKIWRCIISQSPETKEEVSCIMFLIDARNLSEFRPLNQGLFLTFAMFSGGWGESLALR